jgi:hypothetical protein
MKELGTEKDICSFLEKKIDLFTQYLSITKEMKEGLKDKEVRHLEKFLSQRRDCIKRIEKIDLSMEKTIRASSAELDPVSEKGRKLIDGYLSNLKSIMEAVDVVDTELMNKLKEEGEGIKRELLEMRNVRHAARGYKKEIRYSPRFLDTMR